ncbi:MAG: patatin-like phospholipase family protein [Sphaerochaetaceae bacterium]|nr:patatin-like phospholipase family protein [Sphaerochaetaceae bacterium]
MKKYIFLLLLMFINISLFAQTEDILLAGVPLTFGEEDFIERIEERTGGQREPIGLVLSGGSARAFAHIGLLRLMEEEGIVPDFIISNSMGSIIALLYGAGLSPDQIEESILSVNISELFDISLPLNTGVLDSEKFKSFLREFLTDLLETDDIRIEDLEIPTLVVCEDLITKRPVLVCEGDYFSVFEASFALPVYFGSVEYEGCRLIDGGIANLVPLDFAYRYTNTNIVSTTFYAGAGLNYKNPLTGLNISFDIGKRRQGISELLDHPDALWIRCNVEDYSFMDFASINDIAQDGYDSALLKIDELRAIKASYDEAIELNEGAKIAAQENEKSLSALREKIEDVFPEFLKRYLVFNRSPIKDSYSFITVEGFSNYGEGSYLNLRDDTFLGLGYDYYNNNTKLVFSFGADMKTMTGGYVQPSFSILFNQYFGKHFKLESETSFIVNNKALGGYESLSLIYRTFSFNSFVGDFVASYEFNFGNLSSTNNPWNNGDGLASVFVNAKYNNGKFSSSLKGGYEGLNNISSGDFRNFVFCSIKGKFSLFSFGFLCRYSLDRSGSVPIFTNDGYFLLNPKTLSVSSGNVIAIANMGLNWTYYKGKISMAELLLITDNNIGLFANALYKSSKTSFQVGATLSSNISLIGLRNIPVKLDIGYDMEMNKMFWSLVFKKEV